MSSARQFLNGCNNLPHDKAIGIQTRFYFAGTAYESRNSIILEEVAHLDSLLETPKPLLNDIECTPIWPNIKAKCDRLKALAKNCKSAKQARFDLIVKKNPSNDSRD